MKLALPLVFTGFVESSVGFFNTLFLAHLGTEQLAAGAVVQWIFFTMLVILWGTMTSVSVIVSQKYGERDEESIARTLRDGLTLAVLLFIPSFLVLRNFWHILIWLGQSEQMVSMAKVYMQALSWSLLGDFLSMAMLQFLIGLGHTRLNMFFTLLWVPINIFANYVFMFGKFGIPALGIAGVGWGTTVAFTTLAVVLGSYFLLNKNYRKYLRLMMQKTKTCYLGELFRVGLPMGSMYFIEVGFFLTMILIMGKFGDSSVAACQITLQITSQLSIFTFAVAQAITVRMGHTLGARQPLLAEHAVYMGSVIAIIFMVAMAFVFWFAPNALIGIDLNLKLAANQEVISYARSFLAVGALFLVIEAARFSLFGALRGLKDTRFTLLVSIISFWGVSLPIGYFFAMEFDLKGQGLWWGTIIGQLIAVIILYYRFTYKMRLAYKHLS